MCVRVVQRLTDLRFGALLDERHGVRESERQEQPQEERERE